MVPLAAGQTTAVVGYDTVLLVDVGVLLALMELLEDLTADAEDDDLVLVLRVVDVDFMETEGRTREMVGADLVEFNE